MSVSNENQTVIGILGMHRSGTSTLSGSLEEAGVYLGRVSIQNDFNLKGNRENKEILSFHNKLLKGNGGCWNAPPNDVIWKKKHRKTRDMIIRGFNGHPLWGFKDPRTLFTLDGWLEAIPDLKLVGVFRHPILVAQSLHRRNDFPIKKGIDLWCQYNQRLIHYHKLLNFPIISFDEEAADFNRKVSNIIFRLGLNPYSAKMTFFDPSLRNTEVKQEQYDLSDKARYIYGNLQKIAI